MQVRYRLYLSLLWAFSLGGLPAQTPGYEGRLNPISLEMSVSPALADWIFQPEGQPQVNLRGSLYYERVLSRRTSIGGSLGYLQARQNFLFQNQTGDIRIQSPAISLYAQTYRFLRRGNIAPLGPYQKWEVIYLPYRIDNPDNSFPDFGEAQRYHDFVVSFGLGTQRVFAKHFTYHLGLQTGWVLNVPANTTNRGSEALRYLNQITARRLRGFFALNVQLGLGLLLF
jgi:hypothetical protein